MRSVDLLIESIIERLKDCEDRELLQLINSLLATANDEALTAH